MRVIFLHQCHSLFAQQMCVCSIVSIHHIQSTQSAHCSCVCSPYTLSDVNVVLTFNTSLNERAPSSPISLPAFVVVHQLACFIVSIDCIPSTQVPKLLACLFTSQIECCQCCVDLQCITQCTCSFCADGVGWFVLDCFNSSSTTRVVLVLAHLQF